MGFKNPLNCDRSNYFNIVLAYAGAPICAEEFYCTIIDFYNFMKVSDNLQVVLVSEKDSISLPAINCWCKENTWMAQMDKEGFRLSDEISIVNAASTALEQCIRKVPPERKEKETVRQYLLDLANELEAES